VESAIARAPSHIFRRGDGGYEAARRATAFNARVPDRFPNVIVQARDVHGWSVNHVRDGGMLLDENARDLLVLCAQATSHLATFLPALYHEHAR
jgi:hypothetical protein